MKKGWTRKRLNDFVWFQRGYDLPKVKFEKGNVPVYGATSILGFHNVAKVKAPGIITGRSGTLGKFQFAIEDYWPHNTSLWIKDFKGNDEKFAYYFLHCLDFSLLNSGGAVPTLNRNVLNSFIVDIPPLPTQRKIASILSAYDDLIENNLQRIQLLEEKAQLTYEEWFVRMKFPNYENTPIDKKTGLPEGWKKVKLEELIENIQYGFTASANPQKIGPKFLRITDIVPANIHWENVPFCSIDKNQITKYILKEGDIVIARTGATVGYAKRINKKHPYAIFASYLIRITTNSKIDNIVAGKFIESKYFKKYVHSMAGGAAQPNANAPVLKKIKMIVPSINIQKEYRIIVEKLEDLKESLLIQNQLLKEARDLLLPRLMMGIIDVEQLVVEPQNL